jgi:hypothetical protein
MIADLEELVTSAVTELSSTMLGKNMLRAPLNADFGDGESHVAGSVGSVGRLNFSQSVANDITAHLLEL